MSMTKNKKWSRLLFTLLIVVALGLAMLPGAAFADDCDVHPSGECDLQVNIVKPDPGTQVPVGQCFWVNAAVARPYDAGTVSDVYATLNISGDAYIEGSATQGPRVLNNCDEVIDFWWKVCCTGTADVSFYVTASGTSTACGSMAGTSDTREVVQIDPVCDPCLVIEIIECGPEDEQGLPLPAYPDESMYAVKALIHNVCDEMICDVTSTISWTGDAELAAGYPSSLNVGCIFPDRYEEVGWTLVCTGGEDAVFTVDATCTAPCDPIPPDCDPCDEPYIPDPCNGVCTIGHIEKDASLSSVLPGPATCVVDQICPAAIGVEITEIPEKVCAGCDSEFQVVVDVCELCGETALRDVTAQIFISGDAVLVGNDLQVVCTGDCTLTGCETLTWTLDCTGEADVDVYVEVRGTDVYSGETRTATSTTKTVKQYTQMSVEVLSPADNTVYNVCEPFELSYRVTNCTGEDIDDTTYAGFCLTEAENVVLAGVVNDTVDEWTGVYATITPCPDAGPTAEPYLAEIINRGEGCYYIPIDCICACCYVDITVPLQCVGSDLEGCQDVVTEMIQTYCGLVPGQWLDEDDVYVNQMYKAHLTSTLAIYEGVVTEEADTLEGEETICAITQGESFTVVAVVANQGEATAQDVTVSLGWTGSGIALLDTPIEQNIGEIDCHGAAKAIWRFTCIGEGPVSFYLESISGYDVNFEAPIHTDNIETACSVKLEQIPLGVTIIQPITSTDFLQYECFTIKARVTNLSTVYKLDNVFAKLRWYTEQEGCDPCGDFILDTPNPIDVTPGDDYLMPGESALVTWQVCCCSPGDVSFWIDVYGITVFDNALNIKGGCSVDIMSETNTIHQWEKGGVVCYILSPHLEDFDVCHEYGDPEAYIATGQEFSVTGKLINTGDLPFMVNAVELSADGWLWGGEIEAVPDFELPIILAPFGEEGDSVVVSFDAVCTESGKTDILMQASGVSLPPDQSPGVADSCMSFVCIEQYEAAHLVVNITSGYPDPIDLGSEFEITATVQNTGEADAWEVSAVISVFPATSAEVSANDQYGSYTRDLDNLTGHGVNETEEVTWLMRCKDVCDTTITVTAYGYDESGYEVKQICTSEIKYDWQVTCCELLLDGTPGAPIQSRFIKPASITVKQEDPENGGEEEEEEESSGNFDLMLYAGWNLVSSPWYIAEGNRDPGTVLSEAIPGVERVFAYDRATSTWLSYIPDGPPPSLTEFRDGPGYWVLMPDDLAEPVVVTILDQAPAGDWSPPTYTVGQLGWSLVGPRIGEPTTPKTASEWLNPLSFALILGYNHETGAYFEVGPNDPVEPGAGYWVAFTSTGDRYR